MAQSPKNARPQIFDADALARAQARAARRQARRGTSFLYQRVVEDAASRLEDINRRFARAVMIGQVDGRESLMAALPTERQPEVLDHLSAPNSLSAKYDLILSLLEGQSDDAWPETLARFRKHLAPDGLLLVATLGGETLTELRQGLYAADQSVLGGATARVYPMVDYSQAAMLLGRTGLALPVVDTDRLRVHYGALDSLVADLRDLGLSNVLTARHRRPVTRSWRAALEASYAQHFAREDGKLTATFEVLWLTGWAPHASQQKPLKPGSAKMRLSDALKTDERKI